MAAEGSEAYVYVSQDNKYVIKAMSAIASDGDIVPLLQKIELHNQIFPDTSLEILGFGKTMDGSFRVIVQQPFIQGDKISAQEAEKALIEQLGVTNNAEDYSQTLFNGMVVLRDITNPDNRGNILKDSDGNYFVIDADIAFNKDAFNQPQDSQSTSTVAYEVEAQADADNSPINIWSTEKNGYESLSNLAERPYVLDSVLIARIFGEIPNPQIKSALSKYLSEHDGRVTINSVENLFQAMKLFYSEQYVKNGNFTPEGKQLFHKIINEASGTAKHDGGKRGIIRLDDAAQREWDNESKAIMKVIAQYSFDSNPGARQLLLSTGNRQLTHVQGDKIWRVAFPAVLMDIRDQYRKV